MSVGDGLHVGFFEAGRHGAHDRVFTDGGFAVPTLEFLQLLEKVFGNLAGEFRIFG